MNDNNDQATPAELHRYSDLLNVYGDPTADNDLLSEWWRNISRRRGGICSVDEMRHMFVLGNRANKWTRNLLTVSDATMADVSDPIYRRILSLGQPDIGFPEKDISIDGRAYSSLYLFFVEIAANIVRALDEEGIINPRILEIGGGYGILLGILRSYYAQRCTIYSIEIPESMMLQEWYLRSCFPDAEVVHKMDAEQVGYVDGGLNFISAYTYDTQDFEIDVAINITSMCEISIENATQYFRFIERNMSEGGVFFFENVFGGDESSFAHVPEYPFDEHWKTLSHDLAPLHKSLEYIKNMRVFLQRRKKQKFDPDVRRFVYRCLFNALHAGVFPRSQSILKKVAALTECHSLAEAKAEVGAIARTYGSDDDLTPLYKCLVLPESAFIKSRQLPDGKDRDLEDEDLVLWELETLQRNLVPCMNGRVDTFDHSLKDLCDKFTHTVGSLPLSETWAGQCASTLFALGRAEEAQAIAYEAAMASQHEIWLARLAHVLAKHGRSAKAQEVSEHAKALKGLGWLTRLNLAVTDSMTGLAGAASEELERQFAQGLDIYKARIFVKAASCSANLDLILKTFAWCHEYAPDEETGFVLDALMFASAFIEREDMTRLLAEEIDQSGLDEDGFATLKYGALCAKLDCLQDSDAFFQPLIDQSYHDFFQLAGVSKHLYWAGQIELARSCAERSLSLRPNDYNHMRFIAQAQLDGGDYANARVNFNGAARLKPYMLPLWGRGAYCGLADRAGEGNLSVRAQDLDAIFPLTQDHYQDINPSHSS